MAKTSSRPTGGPILQPEEGVTARDPDRVVWVLLALNLLLLFFVLPHSAEGDGRLRFEALQSLLAGHGIPDTKYPLLGSLPSVPLIWLGDLVGTPEWWVARYNVIVYAAGIGALYSLLRGRIAGDVLGAWLLLMGTTAMLPNALTGFGAEPFSAMAIGIGLVAWALGRWKTATVLLGVGIANQPATLLGVAFAVAWWAWREKRLRALAPLVLGAGLVLADNLLRRGSAFVSGYENNHGFQTLLPYSGLPGFSYPTFFGVLSLVFSFGKGLLFFASGLVLPFGSAMEALRPVKDVLVLWALFLGGTVLVYGTWWAWYGGFTWGPRFLVFASLPASLLLAAHVRRPSRSLVVATVVLAAFVLSVWVGIDGATFGRFGQSTCNANDYYLESFCWYVPEFSVLWTPFVFHPQLALRDPFVIAFSVGVAAYVAWPLLRSWPASARGDARTAWAAFRNRGTWRL